MPQFKFQVALEALKELRSVNEIAASNKVHPSQVTAWKKELREGGSQLFERKNGKNREFEDQEAHTAELERTLGKIVIEKEFLIKSASSWGSNHEKSHGGKGSSSAQCAGSVRTAWRQSQPLGGETQSSMEAQSGGRGEA
ncbi:MAG: transposase [Verrucomicrobiales bacterium]